MTFASLGIQPKEFRIMKYTSLIFILALASCGGSDNNPFAPVPSSPIEQTPTPVADDEPIITPDSAQVPIADPEPVAQPEPVITPEPTIEPVTQPEPESEPVSEPAVEPVPVAVEENTPESDIEGIWYCKQFDEEFTWELRSDRTVYYNNPGVFQGVIGTYWHIQDHTFALGYSSGGIAEFTCDGEVLNGGSLNCSREPIVGD